MLIIDTVGYDSTELRSVLQCADLLVISVRPSLPTAVNSLTKVNGIIKKAQELNLKLNLAFCCTVINQIIKID